MRNDKVQQVAQKVQVLSATAQVVGNEALLCANKLGFTCSRQCPGDIILRTYDFARLVRGSGWVIVGGFHSPIEKDCLPIFLRGAHPIIMVQAHRLSTSRVPSEWRERIDAGRLLLLSPFRDKDKRTTRELAIERNRFVAGIADAVLIPYAHPGSNTEVLALDCLQSGKTIYTFESRSNKKLIQAGARPIAPDYFASKPKGESLPSAI